MSRRRYLSTEISLDARINRLATEAGDFAVLSYTWMIPHAEDDGSITADPEELIFRVFPGRRDKSAADMDAAINPMIKLGLVAREDRRLIFPPEAFYRYQSYIPADKRRSAQSAENQRPSPKNTDNRRASAKNAVFPSPSPSPKEDNTAVETAFETAWSLLPKRDGGNPKGSALKNFRATMRRGNSRDELIAGATRYAAYIRAAGQEFTKYVQQARTFYGPDENWRQDWEIPKDGAHHANGSFVG